MAGNAFNPDFPTEIVREGRIRVLVPKLRAFLKEPSDYAPSKAPVFYNPVMELNRDISVLAVQAYQEQTGREIAVCDPLTGCGVRAVRYAVEVRGVKQVVGNDISSKAVALAAHNVQMNELDDIVTVKREDANLLLASHSAPLSRFDVIDVDPFGSPAPYLDSAIRALRSGGMLAVTATDMAPLCGVHPKACVRKYGGKPLRTEYCHELAARLVAGCMTTAAAKHDMGVQVVFSQYADHYVRIYATVKHGAKQADESISNMGHILHCFKCLHREVSKERFLAEDSGRCRECGSKLSLAGPLWTGRLFDKGFCELMAAEAKRRMLKHSRRVENILDMAKGESDAPTTYYVVDALCDLESLPVPPTEAVADGLRKEGFTAVLTHFNVKGIRSDISSVKIREIMREIASSRAMSH